MKTNTFRNLALIFGFLMVVAMFVLMFFANVKGNGIIFDAGKPLEFRGIVIGTDKYYVDGVAKSMSSPKNSGLNLLPFIGGLVAITSGFIAILVGIAAKPSVGKIIVIILFGFLAIAGSITQFFALDTLPYTMAMQNFKEQGITPSESDKQDAINFYKDLLITNSAGYQLKLGLLPILSGVLGIVGGALISVSGALDARK